MANIDINSLEPNSHKYKSEKIQNEKKREKRQPIIDNGQIVSTRKPLGKKIADTFLTEDIKDVKSWLIFDILLPGIKNTILDLMSMMFFGETNSRSRGRRLRRNSEIYSYNRCYEDDSSYKRNRRSNTYESDDKLDFRNIVLKEREDAERIIKTMREQIRDLDSVSVADLFDLIGVAGKWTDNNWGWDDERDIGIRRVSSGYLIDVAEPKYLN